MIIELQSQGEVNRMFWAGSECSRKKELHMQRHWSRKSTSGRKTLRKATVPGTGRSRQSMAVDKVKGWFDHALDTEETPAFIQSLHSGAYVFNCFDM